MTKSYHRLIDELLQAMRAGSMTSRQAAKQLGTHESVVSKLVTIDSLLTGPNRDAFFAGKLGINAAYNLARGKATPTSRRRHKAAKAPMLRIGLMDQVHLAAPLAAEVELDSLKAALSGMLARIAEFRDRGHTRLTADLFTRPDNFHNGSAA